MLVTGLMVLWMGGESMARQLAEMVASGFSFDHRLINDPGQIVRHISRLLGQAVSALLPMMAGPVLVAIASPMLLGGIVLSGKSLSPSFSKLNPLSGLKRMFSAQTAAELLKAVLKAVLVGSVAGWYVWSRWPDMLHLITESPRKAPAHGMNMIAACCFWWCWARCRWWASTCSGSCSAISKAAYDASGDP